MGEGGILPNIAETWLVRGPGFKVGALDQMLNSGKKELAESTSSRKMDHRVSSGRLVSLFYREKNLMDFKF